MNRHHSIAISSLLLGTAAALAGPVTTVPWNGHTGATSFGYDDCRVTQLPTVIPALDALGIKGTFFLTYNAGGDLSQHKSQWIAAGKNGHELANHTYDHANVSDGDAQVAKMADDIKSMDPSFEAVTFAYPNCVVGGTSTVGATAFLARGCQFVSSVSAASSLTYYSWASQPSNWMDILSLDLQPGNGAVGLAMLDGAKSGNSWAVIFTHDVSGSPDQYSATTSDHQAILNRAVSNQLWIGTYSQVGAYYRAHFTMDAVTASGSGPWNLTWTSPHPKMPKSVMLKVKLDMSKFGSKFTVSQNNVAIPANSDGSYTIDFMKLKMTVTAGTDGIDNPTIYGTARATVNESSLVFGSLTPGDYTLSLRDISGKLLQRKALTATSGDVRTALPASARGRILAVLQAPGKETRIFQVLVP